MGLEHTRVGRQPKYPHVPHVLAQYPHVLAQSWSVCVKLESVCVVKEALRLPAGEYPEYPIY